MPLKAIMYHYVRHEPLGLPFLKYLHAEDFSQQLDFFEQAFGFADVEAFLNHENGDALQNGIVLTFDDGFIDHYEVVLPELLRRGLTGFFFVPTAPLQTERMLPVHRVHHLLGRFDAAAVAKRLRELVSSDMIDQARLREFEQATYRTQKNSEETLFVKRTLNYYLASEHRAAVLDSLMRHFFGDEEAELTAALYMQPHHLQALHEAGMIIGSHSVNHPVMSTLAPAEQENEISTSFAFLEAHLGPLSPRTFCYPYGGKSTFTETTEKILEKQGVTLSFAVDPRDITEEDLRNRPQALPRYDCNMFPYGQCRTTNQ